MLRMPASAFEADARGLVNRLMALRFLWVAATVCVLGAIASVLQPFEITATARAVLVCAQLALALSCLVATRLIRVLSAQVLVLSAAWASVAVTTVVAVSLGHGAHSLDLSFYPLVVCVVAVLVGTAPAFALTLGCTLIVVALAWAESRGWVAGAASLSSTPLSHPVITHSLLLLAGFTIGAIMLRMSNKSYRSAQQREQRFRRLLAIAADHYWELDAELRLQRAEDTATSTTSPLFAAQMKRPLAEIVDALGADASAQTRGLDDLRARRPFAGLHWSARAVDGKAVHLEFSGQPKLDEQGRFTGYWGVARDVTERHQAQQDLAAARDAAEAASRAKSAFLANTSHEIRTPLNGLLGLARLAIGESLSETQRRTYVAHILDSAQGLSATLSDILDLSKIEAGKLDIAHAAFNLRDALQAVCRAEHNIAQAKGLTLELHVDAAVPAVVRGDAMRVRQILGNFVSNAIKFTERGRVRIDAAMLREHVLRLTVTDSGIGIDAAMQQRLFTPFSHADQSTTRRFGGSGLGLSICRELARLMGGGVGMNSALGEGSVFWVDLPLPAANDLDKPAAADLQSEQLATLCGARVLVAEDNPVNMMIAVAMLEQWGVHVVQAADGEAVVDAVERAERQDQPFDAVLMDVQMPRLSGHQAARALRLRHGERTPPIIALTASALVSEREEALSAGMSDFLTKPIDAERMRSVLAAHVRRGRVE
jgi:signal transduction histidine kinase/ActR/RegA family two-component response regulator